MKPNSDEKVSLKVEIGVKKLKVVQMGLLSLPMFASMFALLSAFSNFCFRVLASIFQFKFLKFIFCAMLHIKDMRILCVQSKVQLSFMNDIEVR